MTAQDDHADVAASHHVDPLSRSRTIHACADDEVRRVLLKQPLPCAGTGCSAAAWTALAELDHEYPGMWLLLPFCSAHDRRARIR